jgi:anti-anti-sigma factor
MEMTTTHEGDRTTVRLQGRLDARNADALGLELDECVRNGSHAVRLNLHEVTYISSAGIRILIKYGRMLREQKGRLEVWEPSEAVVTILEMTGTLDLFTPETPADKAAAPAREDARRQFGNLTCQIVDENPAASMNAALLGNPEQVAGDSPGRPGQSTPLKLGPRDVAIGIGAFGHQGDDAARHAGEFLAAGGVALALPPDSGGQPDFMVSEQRLTPELMVAHALHLTGDFAVQARFAGSGISSEAISLRELATAALELADAPQAVLVMLADTAGLVGASLLRSPIAESPDGCFDFPAARRWFNLTPERVHARHLALAVGVVARRPSAALAPYVRPLSASDASLHSHIHAAALTYRTLPAGQLDLDAVLHELLQTQSPVDLLHLVNDDRAISGAGDSLFQRGALWVAPLAEITNNGGAR